MNYDEINTIYHLANTAYYAGMVTAISAMMVGIGSWKLVQTMSLSKRTME